MSLILLSNGIQAQDSAENKLGTWYMYNGSHKLSQKLDLKTSFHVRYFEFITEYQQEIYRVGLTFSPSKKWSFTGGMVYSITDTSYKTNQPNLYEFRFYQDVNLKDKWGLFNINHRVRLAQRFREQASQRKTTHRIRYGLFVNYPVSKKLNLYAFNEIFIKFAAKTFGQNRTGLGFFKQINRKIKLRIGYMHTKFSDAVSHRLQLGIILNTNHIKTKV
ncbi:DUF2490 domain-containing protein [Polaribacter porphyrae]|uniref:DUF2490 domain-containing protein n=1 Tax=Polaribacter porphyrae TaxID=1137780 RepID=UPI001B801F9C|nr:DUF2490 domain-containing protein [Polaribacter porphyrae]